MPTQLHTRGSPATRLRIARRLRPLEIPLQGPWAGYIPDINPNLLQPDAAFEMTGLVVKGEKLTTDDGFSRLIGDNNTDLPFGHNGDASGFNNTTDVVQWGAGLLEATNAGNDVIQPVIRLDSFQRVTASGVGNIDTIAITADTGQVGTGNPPYQESGHLFRLDENADWNSVEFTSQDGGGTPVTNDVPLSGDVDDLPDSCVYIPGVSGTSGGGETANAVAESVFVFTNDVDPVYYYPDVTSGTNYASYDAFAQQLADIVAATSGTAPFTTFKAKSCESFGGRVVYLNTEEAGTRWSQRARWSIIGNPLVVDPATSVNTINGVGAGYVDLSEFSTEGLRVETLGDVCACYFNDGVAFLRRTLIPTVAFSIQYVSKIRGLVATHALVNLGGGVHFGIFTDGWYLLDQAGRWKEVGLVGNEAGSEVARALRGRGEPRITYKWKRSFYQNINQDQAHKIYCGYDPLNKYIRIAWPSGESPFNNEVWIYDLQNDRVFPDDYTGIGGNDLSVACWGNTNRQTATGLTWNGATGTWDAQVETWDEQAPSFAEQVVLHGTGHIDTDPLVDNVAAGGGLVFIHSSGTSLQDGQNPIWSWKTHLHPLGDAFSIKTADRLWIEYGNRESLITQAAATIRSEQANESYTFDLAKGTVGDIEVDHLDYRVPGHHHEITVSGAGCPDIRSFKLQLIIEEDTLAPANRSEGS